MEDWNLSMIHPDMDVCDELGEKIGIVAHVYAPAAVAAAAGGSAPRPREGYVEVKTGLLGLGTHYFIPVHAICDVTQGGVFLSVGKDALDGNGWQNRPSDL